MTNNVIEKEQEFDQKEYKKRQKSKED